MDSVELTVTSNKPLQSIKWSGPNQYSSSILVPKVAVGGDYILMVTDSVGCTASVSTKVEIDSSRLTFDTLVSNITCIEPGAIEILFSEPGVAINWIQSPIPLADGLLEIWKSGTRSIYVYRGEFQRLQNICTIGDPIGYNQTLGQWLWRGKP